MKSVGTGFIGVVCFIYVTFSMIHMSRVNSKMDEWNESYRAIEEDVSAFTKLSDPKTIRLYVKELNKILDNIHFLSKIVESGQTSAVSLDGYFSEYQTKLDEVNDMIFGMHEELTASIEQLQGRNKRLYVATNKNLELIESLQTRLSKKQKAMDTRFTTIVEDIDSLIAKLDAAEETFFGKYIFVK